MKVVVQVVYALSGTQEIARTKQVADSWCN